MTARAALHHTPSLGGNEVFYAREGEKQCGEPKNTNLNIEQGSLPGVMTDGHAVLFSFLALRYGLRSEYSVDGVALSSRRDCLFLC
jgi:hypothetical protein